ncbi:beta-1,4-glucuronyltransferase 1-like [Saccostrea echinata]|uniref:beta-1,4-glucuronyltransferase 1-like n=1 Tax=Saccostrea echinata TaxID=191078 RepID=UPI002A7EDB67|nr:beta-1,4-glucuronyltransferase 1-like [Saccostrea echinata]
MRARCVPSIQKVILFMVVLVIMLQVYHIYLMGQLEDFKDTKNYPNSVWDGIMQRVRDAYKTDSSGFYFLVPDILGSNKQHPTDSYDLALVTHTTSNHLHNLVQISKRWAGPISVSVFTHSHDADFALQLIQNLYACYRHIQLNVFFHLVFPVSSHTNITKIPYHDVDCIEEYFAKSSNQNFVLEDKLKYPHNILRNLAIKTLAAKFVLAIDIDIYPSANLLYSFQRDLLSSSSVGDRTAYIVPVFETGENHILSTKQELLQNKNIHPFYANVCHWCQFATDYHRWESLQSSEKLEVAYEVQWKLPYEPFFIAHKSLLPLYEERFKQYGYNRVSQICEMYVAGYKFFVLNNAFLVHKGQKQKNTFYLEKVKDHRENKALFQDFKEELKSRYPDSTRTC